MSIEIFTKNILLSDDQNKNTTNIIKILSIFLTLAVALLFGYFPLFYKIKKKSSIWIGYINSLNGGIIIGIGLFLLLPESKQAFEEYFEPHGNDEHSHSPWEEMPYAFFLTFLSYSFLLFTEKVAFSSTISPAYSHSHDDNLKNNSDEEEEVLKNVVSTKGKFASFLQIRNIKKNPSFINPNKSLLMSSQILSKTYMKDDNPDIDYLVNPKKSDFVQLKESHNHSHSHDLVPEHQSNILPYLMLIGLCLDGFFEGLAIGCQKSWEAVLFVTLVILINKGIVGFSLGLALKKSNTDLKSFIRLIILFSSFAPLGIVLGLVLKNDMMAQAVMLSLSSGAFIYVSSSVVVIEEFTVTNYRYSKYMFYMLGGLLTAGIKILGSI